jgi:hypothetical protein
MPICRTRVNFNDTNRGANGGHRVGGVPADAAVDFPGEAALDGGNGDGTVFDIPTIDGSSDGTPTSFDGANGAYPDAGLIAAAGDLSGTAVGAFSNMDADSCDCGQGFQLIADSHSNPLRTAFQSIADSIPMIADSSLIDSFKGSFGGV